MEIKELSSKIKGHISKLSSFGVKDKIMDERISLCSTSNEISDTIWELYNIALTLNMDKKKYKSNKLSDLKRIYFSMALFLYEEDKNPNEMLKLSHKMDLIRFRDETRLKKVEIMAAGGCDSCESLNGTLISIKKALQETPLPNVNCTFKLRNKRKLNWCRCSYLAVFD